jgi:hypothetical protein
MSETVLSAIVRVIRVPNFPSMIEMPQVQRARAQWSALYGLIGGLAYALTAAFINPLTFPDLPLWLDWPGLALNGLMWGGGLAALGALVGWPRDGGRGVGLGLALFATLILIVNMAQGGASWATNTALFILVLMPIMAMCAPIPFGLRWLGHRMQRHLAIPGAQPKSYLARWLAVVVVLGLLPGLLARMSPRAENAVRTVYAFIHEAHELAPTAEISGPLKPLPNLRAHLEQAYQLSQIPSETVAEGFGYDVTAHFADGYTFTCVIGTYPGQKPLVRGCFEKP